MRHNGKTILWTLAILAAASWPASAAERGSFEVGAADLIAAGVADAVSVEMTADRFRPPVRYFRSSERLSEEDARKDCADCADLIAVHVASYPSAPGWVAEASQQFVRVGRRLQVRAWIPATKRVVTVTAVSEQTARKISAHLVRKFSE